MPLLRPNSHHATRVRKPAPHEILHGPRGHALAQKQQQQHQALHQLLIQACPPAPCIESATPQAQSPMPRTVSSNEVALRWQTEPWHSVWPPPPGRLPALPATAPSQYCDSRHRQVALAQHLPHVPARCYPHLRTVAIPCRHQTSEPSQILKWPILHHRRKSRRLALQAPLPLRWTVQKLQVALMSYWHNLWIASLNFLWGSSERPPAGRSRGKAGAINQKLASDRRLIATPAKVE
mmetsp:Transcript_78826/g.204854  ORF Transcript_78826/g.204854 Transcript_78826/m.204854 type:complete len:236 (-) Transcript_78826:353-1060(-)